MKRYLKWKGIALVAFLTVGLASCSDDDDGDIVQPVNDDETIAQIAVNEPRLENLVAALQRAELVETLEGDGPFTVLAPSNEAFDDFLSDNEFEGIEEVPVEILQQVLLNHVIAGEISSADLITAEGGYYSTLADAPLAGDDATVNIFFDTTDGVVFNGDAEVLDDGADISASNGVIHLVDGVINLPTVATFIDADPRFQDLDETLESDDQPDFEMIFDTAAGTSPAPFTVFAPVNEAFEDLTELPTDETLTAVLQHHVIGDNYIVSTGISDGLESPATLQGDLLQFAIADGQITITDGAGNSDSQITMPNLYAINGVVHGINAILLPNTDDDGEEDM